jgi:LmbE family N-acetylglucosaminyl deacetylase
MVLPLGLDKFMGARAVVVAAHPDDEIIGAGATLAHLADASVIHVSDGAPRDGSDAARAGFADWRAYAAARRREAEAALALAGIDSDRIIGMGYPDQQTSFHLAEIALRMRDVLRRKQYDCVIAHPYEGGHPDHDAASFAAHAACRLMMRDGEPSPLVMEMTSYHMTGDTVATGEFLPCPGGGAVIEHRLDAASRALKGRMLARHESQRNVLQGFGIEHERFRAAPFYDFGAAPHPGMLHYERYHWGVDGAAWRTLARRAMSDLGLLPGAPC